MKIKKIFITLLFITLFLCSCEQKPKGGLIELTGEEVVNNILDESNKNFIFAVINTNEKNAKEFKKVLNQVANNMETKIYYIDYLHIDTLSAGTIFVSYDTDFSNNSYHVIKNQELVLSNDFKDFKTTYQDLRKYKFDSELTKTPKETKQNFLTEAKKEYKKGNIGIAYNYLNYAWDLNEAKEEYNRNKYYYLVNSWESTHIKYGDTDIVDYISLLIYYDTKEIYTINKKGNYQDFTKPKFEDYKKLYYYVKDDIIYTSKEEKGNYKETYEIKEIKKDSLIIKDIKNNKEINCSRMG